MAEFELTTAQKSVVGDRGGQLLVSAAAGSGKTKVLVERLLARVMDPSRPCDLDDFLIITYTKAAAAELRSKIATALGELLAQHPGSAHLLRQMNRLYCAHISTVHSFCADLLRTRAAEAGIDPEFRVAEETECALVRARVLSRVLEEAYDELTPDSAFAQLVDGLGAGRDDRTLEQLVLEMYDQTQCHADPEAWIRRCREMGNELPEDAGQTVWGAWLMERARDSARRDLPEAEWACQALCAEGGKLEKAYGDTFRALESKLRCAAQAESWDAMRAAQQMEIPPLRSFRASDDGDKAYAARFRARRDRIQDSMKRCLAPFTAPSADALDDLARSSRQMDALLTLVERFTKHFSREKRSRRIVDFSDLEHQTIRLLNRREIAEEVAAQFVEVMVDEYQDTNAVQDAIFTAVSGGGARLFMVGDVKQSIYRFRLADPSIFLKKFHAFPDHSEALDGEPRRILLRQNFRSRPAILAAANHVFRTVMSEQVGDLDYTEEAALEPGALFAELDGPLVELHCIESGQSDDSPGKAEQEAEYVASRIAALLRDGALVSDGVGLRPCRAEDVVILMRSPRATALYYQRALARYGIRAESDQSDDILQTAEVQTLLALLQLVDNPHQDIPLLAVLGGPLFAFSSDLLARIRVDHRKGDFFSALCAYRGEDPAPAQFLARLQELRALSDYMPLDALVDAAVRTFSFLEIYGAMEGGEARRANLQLFVEYASSYSAGSYRLLSDFLAHIEGMKEQGRAIASGAAGAGGAVRIMSVHKSKGLEFPIVVLCDLSRKFNFTDLTRPVLLDPALGAGADVVDPKLRVRYPTIAKQAIAAKKREESVSEELRVLYVAMTRPKDRLIMTYCSKYLKSELTKHAQAALYPAAPAVAAEAKCPGAWVLMAALCRAEAGALFDAAERPDCAGVRDTFPWRICLGDGSPETYVRVQPEQTAAQELHPWDESAFGYRYPHLRAAKLPAKLTATQMKGRDLDLEAAEQTESRERAAFHPPLSRREATARGSATHLAMQFLDEQRALDGGVAAELARLLALGFLTEEQTKLVRTEELERLLHSPLGARLRRSTLAREMKFSILMDARECFPDAPEGESVLVQGVADCILREESGLTVIDYKTDRIAPGEAAACAARYLPQMRTYVRAVEELYGERPGSCLVYFFATGEAVELIDDIK